MYGGNGFYYLINTNMEIQKIIEKWRLNRNHLALQMGMPKGTFNNKLSPKHPTQFSDDEWVKLKDILVALRNDLEGVDNVDFNEVLRTLIQKEI